MFSDSSCTRSWEEGDVRGLGVIGRYRTYRMERHRLEMEGGSFLHKALEQAFLSLLQGSREELTSVSTEASQREKLSADLKTGKGRRHELSRL